MIHCRADVPAIDSVRCPGFAHCGFLVNEDASARWCKRCSVKIKGSVNLRIRGESWVDARSAQQVEGQHCLWQQLVPKVEREVGVGAAEAGNEVVFKRADSALGRVPSV